MTATIDVYPVNADTSSTQNSIGTFLQRHKLLFVILLLAIVMRIGYLDLVGQNDLLVWKDWGETAATQGLFSVYANEETVIYPPIFPVVTGILTDMWMRGGGSTSVEAGSGYVVLVKIFPLLAELGIIVFAYFILPTDSRLRWLVSAILAVYPGLLVATAFWGQTDSLFVLPIMASFVLLRNRRVRWAWVLFTIAILAKPQAVLVIPILVILTFRRYGWKSLLTGLVLMGSIGILIHIPFILASGFEAALRPFLSAANQFPVFTFNGFNLWYIVTPGIWNPHPPLVYDFVSDQQAVVGMFTANQFGLLLFVVYILVILLVVWRRFDQHDEFIWLSAMYFGFFVLRTQIHERYLYPVAVFSLIAVAADRRMWGVALGTVFTFSYNMISPSTAPFYWLGINPLFILGDISLETAILNMLILAALTWIMLTPTPLKKSALPLNLLWGMMLIFLLVIGVRAVLPVSLPQEAAPLDATVDDTFRLRGYQLIKQDENWTLELYWQAYAFNNHDYKLFVHATRGGQNVAQDDTRPQGGNYPTWRWYNNDVVVTTHTLAIPPNLLPDAIDVGMYDEQTMVRAQVSQNGQPTPDNAIVVWKADA